MKRQIIFVSGKIVLISVSFIWAGIRKSKKCYFDRQNIAFLIFKDVLIVNDIR